MKKFASLVFAGLVLSTSAFATKYTLSNGNFGTQTSSITFADGDVIEIPANKNVSFTTTQTISKAITLDVYGELKMTPGNKILTLGAGSVANVYNGGEISGKDADQRLIIGTNNVFNGTGSVISSGATLSASSISMGFVSMATPLPISMVSFEANTASSKVVLNWTAVNDRDEAAVFTIEQSLDGKTWEVVATEASRGAAHQTMSYSRVLEAPKGAKTAIYRIAFEGADAEKAYSAARSVVLSKGADVTATVTAAAGQIKVDLQGQPENTYVFVSTMDGKLLSQARYSEAVSISTNAAGIYLVTITDNSSFKIAQKVVMP